MHGYHGKSELLPHKMHKMAHFMTLLFYYNALDRTFIDRTNALRNRLQFIIATAMTNHTTEIKDFTKTKRENSV